MPDFNSPRYKFSIDPSGIIKPIKTKVEVANVTLDQIKSVFMSDNINVSIRYGGRVDSDYTTAHASESTYDITGTHDKGTAYARFSDWIFANAAFDEWGFPVESLNIEGDEKGTKQWTGYVKYSDKMLKNNLEIPIQSFSTKGGTARVTQSYQTVDKVVREGYDAPDHDGGIGLKGNEYEGCDVVVSNYTTTFERNNLPYYYVNQNYKRLLRNMTGSVNADTFDGMAPGECLFVGCDGKMNITEEDGQPKVTWNLTYEFRCGPNVGGLVIGKLPPLDKRAWDYVWVLRRDEDDPETKTTIPRGVAAYVEQVYLYSNFRALGIY